MTQEITDEKPAITEGDYPGLEWLITEIQRQGQILDRLAVLIPAMEAASKLLDNPVTRWKGRHVKGS